MPVETLIIFEGLMPGWRHLDADDLDEGHFLRLRGKHPAWRHDYFQLAEDRSLATGGRNLEKWLLGHRAHERTRRLQRADDVVRQSFPYAGVLTPAQTDFVLAPEQAELRQRLGDWQLPNLMRARSEAPNFSTETIRTFCQWLDWVDMERPERRVRKGEVVDRPLSYFFDTYVPGWREATPGRQTKPFAIANTPSLSISAEQFDLMMSHYLEQSLAELATSGLHGSLLATNREVNKVLKSFRAAEAEGRLGPDVVAVLDRAVPLWRSRPAAVLDRLWREDCLQYLRPEPRPATQQDEAFLWLVEHADDIDLSSPLMAEWADRMLKELALGVEPAGYRDRLYDRDHWDWWPGSMNVVQPWRAERQERERFGSRDWD